MQDQILELSSLLLADDKARLMQELDKRKLGCAMKIIGGMECIIDIFADNEIICAVRENIKSPKDLQIMADAFKTLKCELNALSDSSTVPDSPLSKKQLRLGVQFGDTKVAIEME